MRVDAPELTTVTSSRRVESVHPSHAASDGAGVRLKRNLGPELHRRLDPFLMLDEFGSDSPDDYIAGFPDHPHRGFETVTYMLEGNMEHKDSTGGHGLLRSGGVQWMKAARGVVHSEMPQQEEGLMQGFQLWLNLPGAEKMDDPEYHDLPEAEIPAYVLNSGVGVKVIAGDSHGVRGPAPDRATSPLYIDMSLPPGAEFSQPIEPGHNSFVYVYDGELSIGPAGEAIQVGPGNLVVLSEGSDRDGVRLVAGDTPARALLIAGRPVGEPIVQYGPFVMNTKDEIAQAFQDYQSGRLIRDSSKRSPDSLT